MHHLVKTYRKSCLVFGAALVTAAFSLPAASASERQYKVEAAYLYSFFNYITWPGYNSPQELLNPVICIYGKDPIVKYLKYVANKVAGERSLTVRPITKSSEIGGCNIFFMRHRISYSMLSSLPADTLTVFKPDDPLDRGGMIELSQDAERINIKINQAALDRNGFTASSRLLELAMRMR